MRFLEVKMITIKRDDLLKTKGYIDVSDICAQTENMQNNSEDLDKILAELLTRKYEGGNNANP